jgi:hypothetical protein
LQISRQHFADGFQIKAYFDVCSGDGSMAIDALTPKRVSLVQTADSWVGRLSPPVCAARAGSAGFQLSSPNRDSAHRYVAVCDLVDLTLSSPLIVFCCWKLDENDGPLRSCDWLHARQMCALYGGFNVSYANDGIPNPHHRARTPPTARSIWFP